MSHAPPPPPIFSPSRHHFPPTAGCAPLTTGITSLEANRVPPLPGVTPSSASLAPVEPVSLPQNRAAPSLHLPSLSQQPAAFLLRSSLFPYLMLTLPCLNMFISGEQWNCWLDVVARSREVCSWSIMWLICR